MDLAFKKTENWGLYRTPWLYTVVAPQGGGGPPMIFDFDFSIGHDNTPTPFWFFFWSRGGKTKCVGVNILQRHMWCKLVFPVFNALEVVWQRRLSTNLKARHVAWPRESRIKQFAKVPNTLASIFGRRDNMQMANGWSCNGTRFRMRWKIDVQFNEAKRSWIECRSFTECEMLYHCTNQYH